MTVQQTPVPARTDVRPAAAADAPSDRPYRLHGTMLSIGASAWALSMIVLGGVAGPEEGETLDAVIFGLGSGLFQVGLLFLVRALYRSQALGSGRVARTFLRIETAMIGMAMVSTTVDTLGISDLDQVGWALVDAFWPLSMLGMFGIAIRVAIAGRWKGASRYWPLVAESWAVVVIPTLGIFGETAAGVVAIVHLLVGYTVLGQLVARKQS